MAFDEAAALLKRRYDCIALAVGSGSHDYVVNPPRDRIIRAGDALLVISRIDPEAALAADPPTAADRSSSVSATA